MISSAALASWRVKKSSSWRCPVVITRVSNSPTSPNARSTPAGSVASSCTTGTSGASPVGPSRREGTVTVAPTSSRFPTAVPTRPAPTTTARRPSVVGVPALARLAAQLPRLVFGGDERVRSLGFIPGQLEGGLADEVGDIQTDQVHELERAHGVAQGGLRGGVDVLDGGDVLLHQVEGLGAHRPHEAVGDEPGDLRVQHHRVLAHLLDHGDDTV